MRGGTRPGAGRKPAKIDLLELEKLCSMHASVEELADFFGVSTRTIENRRKQPKFGAAMARGRSKGKLSVRRAQMKLLEAGNATMAVWLGKQWLAQRDVRPVELGGPNGQKAQITLEVLDEILSHARKDSTDSEAD
jgi:hypothetical protein